MASLFPLFEHNALMTRETLRDFFDDHIKSTSEFLIYDDGYRTRTYTYHDIRRAFGLPK